MEVKVGIQNVAREVVVETNDTAADVEKNLRDALANAAVFALSDEKGRSVLIPAAHIAYVDLGSEHARPVGFGAV
ncbi:DUF3107 domain-containing protein [Nigerium sp.]|mgnify:CR=1 FL=1|jgi:polysaccharide deacetylase 2 family uncharacterized protein YibQ|uniref:DUF3107 domain-containing protein n=1 Tax=Nigerium sp. TaxID=2042655 RepID=UPI0032219DFD